MKIQNHHQRRKQLRNLQSAKVIKRKKPKTREETRRRTRRKKKIKEKQAMIKLWSLFYSNTENLTS